MRIGVPKEIKTHEYRVGLTPASVRELVEHEHEVLVETGAGHAIGLLDALYEKAGARIAPDAEGNRSEAESRANARLIAAAPDMAALLELAAEDPAALGLKADSPWMDAARAALKKAGVLP